jgi:hypothetical protein
MEQALGSPSAERVFTHEHLSVVEGLRLADGREVVVKVRPDVRRAAVCVEGQTALHRDGFPCPRPLTEVVNFDGMAVHVEEYASAGHAPEALAMEVVDDLSVLFADLVERSSRLSLRRPRPRPMWLAWDHPAPGVWPDDPWEEPPAWLTELARRVRARLQVVELDEIVAHGDWEIQNFGWRDERVHVVHDWDSLTTAPESALVGAAAATFRSGYAQPSLASVLDTERFLSAYQNAAGRRFTDEELEVAWATGLWLAAHNGRMEVRYQKPRLVLDQLQLQGEERLARAGA